MGNHRADVVVDERLSDGAPSSPYVGKRRAVPAPEVPAEPQPQTPEPTPYVGKRRRPLTEEAPTPEVEAARAPEVKVPDFRAPEFRAPGARAGAMPADPTPTQPVRVLAREVETVEATIETTRWPDLRIDTGSLPPLEETAAYATDFGSETTAHLPVVATGKRRADGGSRRTHPLTKHLPSTPLLLGVAALAVSVGGAVGASHTPALSADSSHFVAASALSGASDVGQVGTHRGPTVSRSTDRSALVDKAASAAEERAATLSQINNKAAAMDKWKAANQWGLPITAGEYHLTGRFNDVSGLWATVHTGLDFACPTGTPIHAVASGTITETGWAGAYGNRTVETLPDGTELWYAHQVRFGSTPGEKVTEGQVIGYVGSTGNTTGPHVHLEVRPGGGDPVDPDTALKAHGIDPDANQ
jgi:murein DD-endopeptidase MepM/ murein hydrolase activator NlpD